jgi:uncharacterized protein (DUF952 family)
MLIYHILTVDEWKKALNLGSYQPASLQQEGFIHFSKLEQVLHTANHYYANQDGLCVLVVDTGKLVPEIRMENTSGGTELFPHLYGSLNLEAVQSVVALSHDAAGLFPMPAELNA